jgi:hypothetical protein
MNLPLTRKLALCVCPDSVCHQSADLRAICGTEMEAPFAKRYGSKFESTTWQEQNRTWAASCSLHFRSACLEVSSTTCSNSHSLLQNRSYLSRFESRYSKTCGSGLHPHSIVQNYERMPSGHPFDSGPGLIPRLIAAIFTFSCSNLPDMHPTQPSSLLNRTRPVADGLHPRFILDAFVSSGYPFD